MQLYNCGDTGLNYKMTSTKMLENTSKKEATAIGYTK